MTGRRKASHVVYETEEDVRRALIEVCAFLFFVCITTYIALSLQKLYAFHFNETVKRTFSEHGIDSLDTSKIHEVATVEEFWKFTTKFFDKLSNNSRTTNESINSEEPELFSETRRMTEQKKMLFLDQNLILEAPRLRQIRIKPDNCYEDKAFKNMYKECYGPYKAAKEFTEPEFLGTKFYSLKENNVVPFWGSLETYYGAGYVVFLTYDKEENVKIINDLQKKKWIDRASRLVIIEMVIYNNNLDLFNNFKINSEIMLNGGVFTHFTLDVAPLFTIWSTKKPEMLAANIIFYAFIAFNTATEIFEISTFGVRTYLKSVWNYFDWGILLTSYCAVAFSIAHGYYIDEFLSDVFHFRYNKLSSIDMACRWFSVYVATMACVAFLVWIRIFRFISFNKTMLSFYLALRKCARDIFGFAIIIFIVFMAFAILGLALFGTSNLDFSTFKYAYFFMIRLLLHDFEYSHFEVSDMVWGPIFFMIYIVIVVFLLFNMFLAIISQTYIDVKQDTEDNPSAIRTVFIKLWHQISHCCRKIHDKLATNTTPQTSLEHPVEDDSPSSGISNVESTTARKIQFEDDSVRNDSLERSSNQSVSKHKAKEVSEDEALNEYFGMKPSTSKVPRSVSDYTLSQYVTPESSIFGFEEQEQTKSLSNIAVDEFDLKKILTQRLETTESMLTKLSGVIDKILAKLTEAEKQRPSAGLLKFD